MSFGSFKTYLPFNNPYMFIYHQTQPHKTQATLFLKLLLWQTNAKPYILKVQEGRGMGLILLRKLLGEDF